METNDNIAELHSYAVAHYGAKGHKETRPFFFIDSAPLSKCTTNIAKAKIYNYIWEAEAARKQIDDYLHQSGHPLAGRVKIVELLAEVMPDYREEDKENA